MSNVNLKKQSSREQFIEYAKTGKILINQCVKCNNLLLETMYYCNECFSNSFKQVSYTGTGKVVTFTIQSIAPEGFEDVNSYAWVVFKLDECRLNVSGFLPGISSPNDLPLGTPIKVIDFNDKHGLVLEKLKA
ncbi:MAG: OB-fold domain-containing protein [Nitrosopumilus sp.]|nr:OB-fold domain-containing protein [Nitrosopumilus sp.]